MKPFWPTLLVTGALLLPACAQLNPPGTVTTHSSSGQFVVSGNPRPSTMPMLLERAIGTNLVQLEPTLLAVSCERVKRALLWELGAQDRWRSKIFIALHPIRFPGETIQVTSTRFADGWVYRLDMPDALEPDRFVRAMVRVLLVEWANRACPESIVDVPAWLSEGLAEQLLANQTTALLIGPPTPLPQSLPVASDVRQQRKTNSLARAHEFLQRGQPLALNQLIRPKQTELFGDDALAFRYSAQLLLVELLQLANGNAALCGMLDGLAAQPDAATALVRAFAAHFQTEGDMEKWWELRSLRFVGRELGQTWPPGEGLARLDEILRAAVLTRTNVSETDSPPVRAELPLQEVIRDWGYPWQPDLVRSKLVQLQVLQWHVTGELAALINDYRQTLQFLLARMVGARSSPNTRLTSRIEVEDVLRITLKKLDALDARREALRQKLASAKNGASSTPP